MNGDLFRRLSQVNGTPRCGARTHAGAPCRAPAMSNGKCRLHGGLSPGAPRGAANGRYTDGHWTREAVEERRFIRLLLNGTLGDMW
ncbi:MAG: HGGxSTG domain-containing protein [Beijerinckiaceae bacterium]|nr:HGGxSTG domain-containing protein [Beijerinckiaceae bacterium]